MGQTSRAFDDAGTQANMLIAFVRRQSPDWTSLSKDFRAHRPIDPARFVPTHHIPGFPERVDHLIDLWNQWFNIDFFTFRSIVARLSRRNIESISNACIFDIDEIESILRKASAERSYVYFHDDDDFFSPELPALVQSIDHETDVVVTPLLRLGNPVLTFVRDGADSDLVIGRRENFHFRFQTNNYGVNGRRIGDRDSVAALRDHVLASSYATDHRYSEIVLPTVISATVKTPASASMLPIMLSGDDRMHRAFVECLDSLDAVDFSARCNWLANPLRDIVRLMRSTIGRSGYDGIADLLES